MKRPPGPGERRRQLSVPPGAVAKQRGSETAAAATPCLHGGSLAAGHSPPLQPRSDGPGCPRAGAPAERALQRAPYPEWSGGEERPLSKWRRWVAGAGKGQGEPL